MNAPWRALLNEPNRRHIVQIYRDEDFLAKAVIHFAASGLDRGQAVVLVGTDRHRRAICTQLSQGFDLDELSARGQLRIYDAEATLESLMRGGLPDAATFNRFTAAVLEECRSAGYPRVRFWGEMVNLLNLRANQTGVICLEELWDNLLKSQRASLLCSFHLDAFDAKFYDGFLQHLCRTHGHVIPAADYDVHRECVDRAIAEVFGRLEDDFLLMLAGTAGWSAPEMPSSQALLFWLREARPEIAGKVLAAASRYEMEREWRGTYV